MSVTAPVHSPVHSPVQSQSPAFTETPQAYQRNIMPTLIYRACVPVLSLFQISQPSHILYETYTPTSSRANLVL